MSRNASVQPRSMACNDPPDEHLPRYADDLEMPARSSIARYRPILLFACALFASCRPPSPNPFLLQRGYLWQRDWTPAVTAALTDADRQMDGIVVLAAEIQWNAGKPSPIRANLSFQTLKSLR